MIFPILCITDGYPNVFSNHIYDNTLDTGSRKGSAVDDSGVVYVYDGKRGKDPNVMNSH